MGWLIFLGLAILCGAGLWKFGKFPRAGIELLGAALFLAVAGYAWQGQPGMAGAPKDPPAETKMPDSAFALEREKMLQRFGSDADVLGTADAFHRQGLNQYAIGIIKGALEKRPNSADLWVGLGNALVIQSNGMMSPAAQFSFDRAAAIAPEHPGPPFFMGLAYAQAGQMDRAEQVWRALLDRSPQDVPWRPEIEQRLAEIAAIRARR